MKTVMGIDAVINGRKMWVRLELRALGNSAVFSRSGDVDR